MFIAITEDFSVIDASFVFSGWSPHYVRVGLSGVPLSLQPPHFVTFAA
jgi:hypothetical protein